MPDERAIENGADVTVVITINFDLMASSIHSERALYKTVFGIDESPDAGLTRNNVAAEVYDIGAFWHFNNLITLDDSKGKSPYCNHT